MVFCPDLRSLGQGIFSKAKEDSSSVITEQLAPFPINHDDNTVKEFLRADDTDTITVQMLQCLFEIMETLLKRQAADHLPSGRDKRLVIYQEENTLNCGKRV